jgi:hypothetical protein
MFYTSLIGGQKEFDTKNSSESDIVELLRIEEY